MRPTRPFLLCRVSRRSFLAAAALTTLPASSLSVAQGKAPLAAARAAEECPRCNGVGLVPLLEAKPFVWVEGTPAPKPESAVGEQACPQCGVGGEPAALVAAWKDRFAAAHEQHAQWKERLGGKLTLVMTRHAALHTQFTTAQARQVGQALETLTLHLKRVAGSLALTPTRLGKYEQVLLWEKPAWEQFRKVMEGLYTSQPLGEGWYLARDYNSYDHFVTPHLYETPQTSRQRPVTHGPVFLAARRQISAATKHLAPTWLAEGFAEYGDHAVHKANRWYTIYDSSRRPPVGDWIAEARRLALAGDLRPWDNVIRRELRDWEPNDYVQTLGMVAFLLEAESAKFIDFARKLAAGEDQLAALEDTFRLKLDELSERCTRWLAARR